MAGNKIKQGQVIGLGEKIFNAVMVILGVLITFIALYPIYYVLISSFSNPFFVENGNVLLKIKEFTTASYEAVFKRDGLWTSYGNAVFYTVFGLMANMFFTTTMAYALSRKYLIGRKILTLFTVFTMWFSAGIIPTYMNFSNLGLLNTRTAIIFGFAIETYNLIIMKSFFERSRRLWRRRHLLTARGISGYSGTYICRCQNRHLPPWDYFTESADGTDTSGLCSF